MSSILETFGSAAKSFEDSLFARVSSVNDACTPQGAGWVEGFRNFDDEASTNHHEERRHEMNSFANETGFARAEERVDGWRKGYRQTPQQQQQQGYGQTPPQQQHYGQTPPQQQHYRQTPLQQGQLPTRPSLPEPRRPSLPPPRGAPRSATIAESFSAAPQRVECALNPAAFAAPSAVVSNSPPSPPPAHFLGAAEQIHRTAPADPAPPAAPTTSSTADLLGDLDLGRPPEQAFFEQPVVHAIAEQPDLLEPAAAAGGGGSFWDTFAQDPRAAPPTLVPTLPAQGVAGWGADSSSTADAVRREIRAAAAREDYAEAARLQAELRQLEFGEIGENGGGAGTPLARAPASPACEMGRSASRFEHGGFEQGGFGRRVEAIDESEML